MTGSNPSSETYQDGQGKVSKNSGASKANRPKLPRPDGPPPQCPRCNADTSNTKFCYYNNYNINQPRYYCKVRGPGQSSLLHVSPPQRFHWLAVVFDSYGCASTSVGAAARLSKYLAVPIILHHSICVAVSAHRVVLLTVVVRHRADDIMSPSSLNCSTSFVSGVETD